jgi:uncharacterized SAM-binding protein YcdF (DUF218 family)
MTTSSPVTGRKFGGLVTRRERWGLSWQGMLVLLLTMAVGAVVFALRIFPFFAITERVETKLMAVEGWVNLYAIQAAADEFRLGGYERVFTTGGPVAGMGGYTNDYNTSASVAAGRLRQVGLPAAVVQMVPSREATRDRTYSAAVALRVWCEANQVRLTAINVVTGDVHARRTRLLYERALGPGVKVGVISVPNPDYDSRRWWRYSQGVRAVFGECLGYVYARLFFHPDAGGGTGG